MSWHYSKRSRLLLNSCDECLVLVFEEVLRHQDVTIVSGQRGEYEQNELHRAGKSQLAYPLSKHNAMPRSTAVDAMACPIDWADRERATLFAGFVMGLALGKFRVRLRWGGDWDEDGQVSDNVFDDLAHFEIVEVVE